MSSDRIHSAIAEISTSKKPLIERINDKKDDAAQWTWACHHNDLPHYQAMVKQCKLALASLSEDELSREVTRDECSAVLNRFNKL